MSLDMRAWKQRSLEVASRSTTALRGQLAQHDIKINRRELRPGERGYVEGSISQKQSWGQWVGAKVASKIGQGGDSELGEDTITMFPGWAVRRYVQPSGNDVESSFGVDVFVSGYASNHRPPEASTRSQRAFMRLAKGFAALPKLQAAGVSEQQAPDDRPVYVSRSTEDLLKGIKLPPRPTEIPADYEAQQMEELEKRFQHLGDDDESTLTTESSSASISSRSSSGSSIADPSRDSHVSSPDNYGPGPLGLPASNLSDDLYKLHANLEARLRPFWSTALSGRLVHLSLFAPLPAQATPSSTNDLRDHGPLAHTTVTTGSDGSFQAMFRVPWESICTHPTALHIAFGDPVEEYPLLVAIQLAPRPTASFHAQCREVRQTVPLTYSPVRVISDIDDTVKMSGIVSGARAVFRNVFVKEMRDLVIPGMGDWYNEMWRRGSNGPFELIPVLSEFLEVAALPPGSVRLKSYAGRSLFNGLLSAPATRKRQGILDVLDNFPESHFILIGDSGEQDLELYATLARERPAQIAAVFIRDVTALDGGEGVRDPTGTELGSRDGLGAGMGRGGPSDAGLAQAAAVGLTAPVRQGSTGDPLLPPTPPYASERPAARRTMSEIASGLKHKPARTMSKLSIMSESMTPGVGASVPGGYYASSPTPSRQNSYDGTYPMENMAEPERKMFLLQSRIYRARAQMPNHVTLRIFRKPEECVEASHLLDKLFVHR
ncbi:hypothetical protein HWV62_19705 [Athelia sp. TMB]|nr:hypothetical protein HWV62_19705 [Athelia sp. TMB]